STGRRLLFANAFGTAKIRIQEFPSAIVVPSSALQTLGDGWVLFVQRGERDFEVRTVRLGVADEHVTQVVEGLSPGETVVSGRRHVLKAELARRRLQDAT